MEHLPAEPEEATVSVLAEDSLRAILRRLSPADLLRAALACRRWCRVASLVLPRAPPLLGYFFHPCATTGPPPESPNEPGPRRPPVFLPLEDPASAAARLSLDAARGFAIHDVHLGLVLHLPDPLHKKILPRALVLDPASGRRALLTQPPRDTLPGDRWRRDRYVVGAAVLSRAHPSRLCFEAVCVTLDGGHPRAWVATVRDGDCTWRALPRSEDVQVEFDPFLFEDSCVHAGGNIYWHICNSGRMLALNPLTLDFSFLLAPAELADSFRKYRIGEAPEDGRLCIAAVLEQRLQLWVRGEAKWSDNGWLMEEFCLSNVLDGVPGLPEDMVNRHLCTWLSDIDAGRSGKVFIKTWGYGRRRSGAWPPHLRLLLGLAASLSLFTCRGLSLMSWVVTSWWRCLLILRVGITSLRFKCHSAFCKALRKTCSTLFCGDYVTNPVARPY